MNVMFMMFFFKLLHTGDQNYNKFKYEALSYATEFVMCALRCYTQIRLYY